MRQAGLLALVAGLSPPTRGNPVTHEVEYARERSIPAHAGEPPSPR